MVNYVIPEIENARVLNRDAEIRMKLEGSLAESVRFLERNQICEVGLWQKFVNVFRNHADGSGNIWISWRSEFWGKMMRGASMVVKYTKDKGMYDILEGTVRDILTAEDELGYPLIKRNQGGRSGSGSELTDRGCKILEAYTEFEKAMKLKMQQAYEACFKNLI